MNRLTLAALLAALVGCTNRLTVPSVVAAQPQLQPKTSEPSPKPFEGAVVSIVLIIEPANLDCLACRGTMRAGRALVQLQRLSPKGGFEPYGDSFAVLVPEDFDQTKKTGHLERFTSKDSPHLILSHILDEKTGILEPDVEALEWALVE